MRILSILLFATVVLANGRMRAVGVPTSKIALGEHKLTGTIDDRIAQITMEQAFASSGSRDAEVFYEFELPEDAAVTSFSMTMNGEWIGGKVLDRKSAKKTYERIVARKKDPGLLERISEGRYRARIFPVPAGQEVRIRVRYQQVLPASEGAVAFRYPAPVGTPTRMTGDLRLTSPRDLVHLASPTHAVEVDREEANKARVVWSGKPGAFVLRFKDQRERVTFTLLSHRRSGEEGTFLAILQPPVDVAEDEILPKDVVFVLDVSGSMSGEKLTQARAALRAGIERLREGDRFNVLSFSTAVSRFRERLVEVNARTRTDAITFLGSRQAAGGTALDLALQESLRFGEIGRLGIVALLTDGLPTVGITEPRNIVARLQQSNRNSHRVFVFGVGLGQNARFLDRIAHVSRAAREDITEAADVVPAMTRFHRRVERPVLTDLRLEGGAGIMDLQPNPLPDLFAGDEVVVTGRYRKSGPTAFSLRGRLGKKEVVHVFEGSLTDQEQLSCLPRFWAKRQVDALIAALAAGGNRGELEPAIRDLGTRYSLVTPFTAGLVVERDGMSDSPFTGPSTNAAIGLGGGAGGGRRGRGGARAPIETEEVDDHNEVDTDSDFEETAGEGGMSDAPFTNSGIGVAGGAARTPSPRPQVRNDAAFMAGLRWLASRQKQDGTFGDAGATAQVLLVFFAAGFTDRGAERENPYAKRVRHGLRYLMNQQREDGGIGKDLTAHIRATTALAEAYWVTRNPRYRKPAQKALDYLARQRAARSGWPKDQPGTRVTAEATLALKVGKYAGFDVDPDAFEGARLWMEDKNAVKNDGDAAAALLTRVLLGEKPDGKTKTNWKPERSDYLTDLAIYQLGDKQWKPWSRARAELLRKAQGEQGSWGTEDQTAAACLRLAAGYRYNRIFR